MKPIIAITFLITLILMGSPMINDSTSYTGSGKGAAKTSLSSGTQDTQTKKTTTGKPGVQSAQMQQSSDKSSGTLPGKSTANLIIIL